jgi:photosystem II stability/assembly factor-like uncharacterized protein
MLTAIGMFLGACRDGTGPTPVAPPSIALSRGEATFRTASDERDPPLEPIEIVNSGGGVLGALEVEIVYEPGGSGWLEAELSGVTAPAQLLLRARGGTLVPGTHAAVVLVRSPEAQNSPRRVEVRLEASPAYAGPLRADRVEGTVAAGSLRDLWLDEEEAVAVGDNGVILRSAPPLDRWSALRPPHRFRSPHYSRVVSGIWRDGPLLIAVGWEVDYPPVGRDAHVYRSTDGGATWTRDRLHLMGAAYAVWGEGSTVVVVGEGGTRSTDVGVSWSPYDTSMGVLHSIAGVPAALVAVGVAGRILRSTDAGSTWRAVVSGTERTLHAVAASGTTRLAVGEGGTLLRSGDGGATWSIVPSGTSSSLHGVWIEAEDALAVGEGGIVLRSMDAGRTWAPVSSGTTRTLLTVRGRGLARVIAGERGTVLFSGNGGGSWSRTWRGTQEHLNGVAGSGSTLVAVGAGGTIRRSTDGGAEWREVAAGTESDLHHVWGAGPTFIAVGSSGAILRSTDGGSMWTAAASATTDTLLAVLGGGASVLAVGTGGTILRSTDGGATWTRVVSGTTSRLTGICRSGTSLFVAGWSNAILRSDDEGASWRVVSVDQRGVGGGFPDIWCADSRLLALGWWGTSTSAGGNILLSTDGGATWSRVDGNDTLNRIAGLGPTSIAVGDAGLVIRSLDSGHTWGELDTRLDHQLRGLWVVGGRNVIAVGESGLILRLTP